MADIHGGESSIPQLLDEEIEDMSYSTASGAGKQRRTRRLKRRAPDGYSKEVHGAPRSTARRPALRDDEEEDPEGDLEDLLEPDEDHRPRRRRETPQGALNENRRKTFQDSLADEDRSGPVLRRWIRAITRNVDERLLLAQLDYWLAENRSHLPEPDRGLQLRWVAKTSQQLAEEVGLTVDRVDKAMQSLRAMGLISWEVRKFAGVRHRHISMHWDAIQELYSQLSGLEGVSDVA